MYPRPEGSSVTKPLRIDGIDLSHFQDQHIDYSAAKRGGVKFVYHKATESTSFVDANYAHRRAEAKAAGLPFGAYHFARPTLDNAKAEARHFLAAAKPKAGDLVPVLDLETNDHHLTKAALTQWVADFFSVVHRAIGVERGILYTPFDLNSVPKGTRLWVARYSDSNAEPNIPAPFKRFTIRQFSDGKFGVPDSVPGVGHVDINHLRDGFLGLAKLAWKKRLTIPTAKKPTPPPPPPPPPPAPKKHRVGSYNAEFGHRPVKAWAEQIIARLETQKLDVLAVDEAQDYFDVLKTLAEAKGHTVVGSGKGSRNALVVRKGLSVSNVRTVPGDVTTWFNPHGHPMSMPRPVVADIDGVTYVVIHAPVDAWEAHPHGGRTLTGPELRVQAYKDFTTNLVAFFAATPGPVTVLGDWNASPVTVGKFSPSWVADQVDARFFRPFASTGHGEIDFGITRGASTITKPVVVPHADFAVKGETGGSEDGSHSDHMEIYGVIVY
jgi:GH25 family lysozyme M1 (1,4-beta-N-acetylmuramidase)